MLVGVGTHQMVGEEWSCMSLAFAFHYSWMVGEAQDGN
jgi:hypothetical protein